MTDPDLAHATYIEPITPEVVAKIIAKERPDALLPTVGGQTALNLAVALAVAVAATELIPNSASATDAAVDTIDLTFVSLDRVERAAAALIAGKKAYNA